MLRSWVPAAAEASVFITTSHHQYGSSQYRQQIGNLHNGDAAYIYGGQGKWLYVENGALNGKEAKFRGWIYNAWCEFYP